MDVPELASVIETVAARWVNPDHQPRARAVEATLKCNNRFTREAIAFAVNQQTHQLQADVLLDWVGREFARDPAAVVVVNPGNIPFVELQDFLAVALVGHRYRAKASSRSPYLLRAFLQELQEEGAQLDATFSDEMPNLSEANALIAAGQDATIAELRQRAINSGMRPEQMLLRGSRFSLAVLGRAESEVMLERLAEDILLHEGLGCRSVAMIFAPSGLSPDPLLDAMARFRAVFPAHPSTAGSLKIQIAFQRAAGLPHAYADDESFLLSRGEPEIQQPCHVRWCEYEDPAEVTSWVRGNRDIIQIVVASPAVASVLNLDSSLTVIPGDAQRPVLGWRQDGVDVVQFLRSLRPE